MLGNILVLKQSCKWKVIKIHDGKKSQVQVTYCEDVTGEKMSIAPFCTSSMLLPVMLPHTHKDTKKALESASTFLGRIGIRVYFSGAQIAKE